MGCLFAIFAGIFPRLGLLIIWIARPARVDAAFDTWIWPLLGLIFLPWTTLAIVIAWQPGGLSGNGDALLVVIGVALDVITYMHRFAAKAVTRQSRY